MHPTPEQSAHTLLLVEDNEADVRLWQVALDELGSTVQLVAVSSGTTALEYLHHQGEYAQAVFPELVVLDLHLPDGSGLEVLAAIRASADERVRALTVVMMTGQASPQEREQAEQLGAAAVLTKGVSLDGLFVVVEQVESGWLAARQ